MSIWDYSITHKINDIWSAIIGGRILKYAIMVLLVLGYILNSQYNQWSELNKKYDLEHAPEYVVVTTPTCEMVVNRATETPIKVNELAEGGCVFAKDNYSRLVDVHDNNVRGINDASNIGTFVVVFFFLALFFTVTSDPSELETNPKKPFINILISWVLVSVLLFPLTYLSYRSVSTFYDNGANITMADVILVEDDTAYIFKPRTFMGQLQHMDKDYPRPL